MLGKNNFSERINKMDMQAKHDRFSIRKLSVGATSVLLGFTFFTMGGQNVQADTVDPSAQTKEVEQNSQASDAAQDAKQNTASEQTPAQSKAKPATKDAAKLDTYDKLSKFLRDDSDSAPADNNASKPDTKPAGDTSVDPANNTAGQAPAADKPANQPAANETGTTNEKPAAATGDSKPSSTDNITSDSPIKPSQAVSGNTAAGATDDKNKITGQQDKLTFNTESQPPTDGKKFSNTTDSTVYVANWTDFKAALTNKNIHDIEVMNNLQAPGVPGMTGENRITMPARKIIIRSGGNKIPAGGYIIDFRMYDPEDSDNSRQGAMDITYQNLRLYSQTYLSVMNTMYQTNSPSRVTFDNVQYTGSQVLYSGQYTDVHIQNNFMADVVASYKNPLDNTDTADWKTEGLNGQQAFQLSENGEKITFEANANAVLSTSDGNVIQMSNSAYNANAVDNYYLDANGNPISMISQVIIKEGAHVTLNPRKNLGRWDENAEDTGKASGIVFRNGYGNILVNQNAVLTINVGADENGSFTSFNGTLDRHRATAIDLSVNGGTITVDGTVNINTNGDISSNGNLVNDRGNLVINPHAALNITGTNMQNYSGTLVSIGGTADLENGAFNIKLTDPSGTDNKGAATGGTGKITLIDSSAAGLTVNNPSSLILDAHMNTSSDTAIIGSNKITIQNVRQNLNLGGMSLSLPPFHKLVVHHYDEFGMNQILVDQLELLNGKKKLTGGIIDALKKDPRLSAMLGKIPGLGDKLDSFKDETFDEIFAEIIEAAFLDPTSMGYNNIAFGPANPDGFLNITNAHVSKPELDDGSRTVSGQVVNYNEAKDGPASDGMFQGILPGGTYVYITAEILNNAQSKSKGIWADSKLSDDPYGNTDLANIHNGFTTDKINVTYPSRDSDPDLPKKMTFAAKVNPDGSFSFTLPAKFTAGLEKGDVIKLTPNANFISYGPQDVPTVLDLDILTIQDAQSAAQEAINQSAQEAIAKVDAAAKADPDQTPAHQQKYQDYKDAINQAQGDALKTPATGADSASIYNPNNDISEINHRKQAALDKINLTAGKSQAYSDVQQYLAAAKNDLHNAQAAADAIPSAATQTSIAAIDDATDQAAVNAAETTAKKAILGDYQQAVQAALKNYHSSADVDFAKLNLSDSQKATYQGAIDNATSFNGLVYKGDGTEFSNSSAILAAYKQIDTTYRKARATSALRNYRDSVIKKYPKLADEINAASAKQEAVIQNETNDSNLQDSVTDPAHPAEATDANRANVPDDKVGMSNIDNVVKTYKQGLQNNINQQHDDLNKELADLQNLLNNHGANGNPDIANGFNDLANELAEAAAIAKGQDQVTAGDPEDAGAIDKGKDGAATDAAHQKAQDLLDDVNHRLAALKELEKYAADAANNNQQNKSKVDHALIDAAKDIFKAPKDEAGKTPITDALNKGKTAIDSVIKYSSAKEEIENAAAAAHDSVNKSHSTQKQKDKYNQAIDAAKNAALNGQADSDDKSSIYAPNVADKPDEINHRKQSAINKIKAAAGKADLDGYAEDVKHDLGITSDDDIAAATAAGEDAIDQINPDSGVSTDNDIASAEQTAKNNILAAAKKNADKQLADKEQAVEDALDKLPTLTGDDLAAAKQEAKDLLHNGAGNGSQDHVAAANDKDGVKNALQDGLADLNHFLLTATNHDKKQQAVNEVNQKRDQVIKDINDHQKYPHLSDRERQDLIDQATDTAKQGADSILNGKDTDVDTNKNTAEKNLDNLLNNASSIDAGHGKELEAARQQALQDLAAAKQQAHDRVNKYSDDQVSQEKKNAILNQIDKDYEAAKNAINTATNNTDITNAEQNGAVTIGNDAGKASLEADKSAALNALGKQRDHDKNVVDQAAKDGKITPQQQKAMKDKIDGFYNDGVEDINNAEDSSDISLAQDTAINKMDNVVNGIDNTALANAHDKANNDLDALAADIKNHIDGLPNLGIDEKNKLKQDVDNALDAAHDAVNSTKTPADANTASQVGQNNLATIANNADLQDAQNAAKQKLDAEKSRVDQALDGLQNLDQASLDALKQDVNNAYNSALNHIKNPNPATTAQVGKDAQAGVDAMDDILNQAQGLDQVKTNDKQDIANAAQAANDRVDKSDLSDQQKQAAHQAINQAANDAKEKINGATSLADANNKKKTGLDAIAAAEAAANKDYLDGLKQQANDKIDEISDAANTALNDEWNSLNEAEQAAAKPAFDQAHKDIESARTQGHNDVNAAKTPDEINQATNQTNLAVIEAKKSAFLASTKEKGKQALHDYGEQIKNQLPAEGKYRDQVDKLVANGCDEIDDDQTPEAVAASVAKYHKLIDGIKNTADSDHQEEINNAKQEAIEDLDHALNGNSTTDGAINEIEKLPNLSSTEKAKYEQQAKDAHDDYVDNVNGDDNVDKIHTDRDAGINKINEALQAAKLQDHKNGANKQIEQARQDAINKVNHDANLTDKQKQEAIDKINNAASEEFNGGKYQVDNSKDQTAIDAIVDNTKNNFDNIINSAKDDALQEAKTDAKNRLKAIADKLNKQINNDRTAGKLSSTQADDLLAAINHDLTAANDKIDNATNQDDVQAAEDIGKLALDNDSSNINKDEAQKADLDAIAAAANDANDKIAQYIKDHPGMTPEQIKHLKDEVANILNSTNNAINSHRQDATNAINNMNDALASGKKKLDQLTNRWNSKNDAVNKLTEHAKDVENGLTHDKYPNLSDSDLADALQEVEAAFHQGKEDIFGAGETDNLDTVEHNAENNIDKALWKYDLANEKSKEIAKLNQHAKDQAAAINDLPGLSAAQKQNYQDKIEAARKKAADKITNTNLPQNPSAADRDNALNDIANAEQGKPTNGEIADYGEAEIDRLLNEAKLNSRKQHAINDLDDYGEAAKDKNPAVDQAAIDNIVHDAEQDISKAPSDPAAANSPEAITAAAKQKIDKLVSDSKKGQDKDTAQKQLASEKADADETIDRSQLTSEQKAAAHKKLQDLYDEMVSRLNSTTKDENGQDLSASAYNEAVKQINHDYQTLINRVLGENPDGAHYPWFDNEADNAHQDLSDKWHDFEGSLSDKQKNKYKDLIDTVNNSIAQLDKSRDGHKTSIADATNAYDNGLTALNKLKAIKGVEDAEAAANEAIDKTNLTDKQKQAYKDQVKQNADKTIADINGVVPTASDQPGNQDKIDTAKQNDIDKIVNAAGTANAGALADARQKAKKAIDDAYNAAKQKLGNAYQPGGALDKAHEHELAKLPGLSYDALQDQTAAIKNVDQGAVDNAASYANGQIDNLKHQDGSSYTDDEKQALKHQVAKDQAAGKDAIENATVAPDTASTARDHAIDQLKDDYINQDKIEDILANDPAVSLDRVKEQAQKDLAAVYEAAKAKLPVGADTSALDAAYNKNKVILGTNADEVKKNAQKAQQDVAKGAIQAAATAAKKQIDGLKHQDGTSYTAAEKEALKNQIDQDAAAANHALDQARADRGGISKDEAEAATGDGTVSGTLNDQLATIAGDSAGNSTADNTALANDPVVQKERAKAKLQTSHDKAVQELHDKFGKDADTSKVDAANDAAQKAIDDLDTNTSADTIHNAEAAGEKEISKGVVEDAQTAAGKLIHNIKHSDTNKPYTADEQAALTNAVQAAVDKANGKHGSIDTTDDVDKARQDAMQDILDTVTDGTGKNQAALNDDATVQHDRELQAAKDQAEKDLQTVYNAAKNNLPNGADTTNLDNAFNHHAPITGDSVAAIKEAAKKAEQDIAKGAIKDAANAAKNSIKNLKHKDGSAYTSDEQAALNNLIDQNAAATNGTVAKPGTIDAASANPSNLSELEASKSNDNAIVSGALNNALNTIAANGSGNSDADQTALNTDSNLVADAKDKAKQDVIQAGKDAAAAVDKLTNHKDGTPYTDAEKQAIKDAIQHEVDKANGTNASQGTIDKANTAADVDTAKNNALNAINKFKDESKNNDENSLAPIVNGNSAVQKERKDKQTARDNVSAAADKARKDLGVAKGSKEAAAIDKAEQDALNAINQVTNGKYSDTENSGLGNIVEAEKNTVKEELGGNSAALDAISSSDTNRDNVTGKQNAIKDAYHAGKVAAAKQKAADKLKAAYDAAKQKLGANADSSALDRSYQAALNNLQGESDDELNKSELAGERLIGKGAVQSAYDTAAKKIEQMWPDDNSQTAKDKKNALLEAAQSLLNEANEVDNGTIDQAHHSTGVSDARNDAIDKINGVHSDKDTINNIIDNDKVVQIDQAHDTAVAGGADQHKVQQIRDDTAKQIKHDLQTGDKEAAKEHELAGEKEIAKLTVQGAADKAKDKINHLDCSEEAKQHLRDEVDKLVNAANGNQGTIDHATDRPGVDTAKDNALNELAQITSPEHVAQVAAAYPFASATPAPTPAKDKATNVTLKHNAYLYNAEGKQASKAILRADSVVATYGITTINGRKYYIVQKGKYYLAVGNVISTQRQVKHNAYVYDKYGMRTNKRVLRAGRMIRTYGSSVSIHGKSYYIIGKDQYVRAANLTGGHQAAASSSAVTLPAGATAKKMMHDAYLYNAQGQRANGVILKAGSIVNTFGTKIIAGRQYFAVADDYYIASGNIIGKKVRLKRAAYTYNQYGQRVEKKVMKKNHKITIYGNQISIHGKKFYLIGQNREIKKSNIK
ncbi:SLAP domain-containing protein [Lactobacillus sp. ESL0680]|uniref:SLAP domain-containing protein n=1 Tax=Lactobacillus sp. ESL0680 TaxID=2983210 RepID=UPI0023F8CB26|nr:SLAP domain-containing protein [Lactobacillus sp. ESL0680]WEV38142.1 SLAP domain-containing protein [Lactobacillus sp. ESL0680]